MADLKTGPTNADVGVFLDAIEDPHRRQECLALVDVMKSATGAEPKMWGSSIVGFGSYHYRYDSGREGDWFLTGFAPRKHNLTLYIMSGFALYDDLMSRLGKHKTGKSCLYLKRLEDVDRAVLGDLVRMSVEHMRRVYVSSE